jgi:hypothetical protein
MFSVCDASLYVEMKYFAMLFYFYFWIFFRRIIFQPLRGTNFRTVVDQIALGQN